MKKLISLVTALVLTVTVGSGVFAVDEPSSISSDSGTSISNDIQVTGTNSFGTMLADTMTAEINEQQENNGFNVFSVEVSGSTATVELETLRDSTVVVGIYDESGSTLLQTANANITANDEYATVTFTKALPQYFYIKAYLIDSVSMRPLCTVYENPNYTREMQEFFSKTTDDFDPDRVLNLDNDKTNNFAVYGEGVIVIPYKSSVNTVISADNGKYVIGNADEYFTGLEKGDIFAYEYGDGELIIASVGSVSVDGSTVTITEGDVSLESAFEYIRIEAEAGMESTEVDNSDLGEDVEYLGRSVVDENGTADPYAISTMAFDPEGSSSVKYTEDYAVATLKAENDNVKLNITGKLSATLSGTIKYYVSLTQQYVEVSVNYEMGISLTINANGSVNYKLGKFYIVILPGVNITVTPTVQFEVALEAKISGKMTGALGFRYSNTNGFENKCKEPKFNLSASITGKLYMGISLEPAIELVHENIAKVSLAGKAGVEILGTMELVPEEAKDHKLHSCSLCVDGSVKAKFSVSCGLKLLNIKQLTFDWKLLDKTIDLFDFYYSLDHKEFGKGDCPHMKYGVTFHVVDSGGKAIKGVFVMPSSGQRLTTGEDGYTSEIYLDNGTYTVSTLHSDYQNKNFTLKVDGSPVTGKWVMLYGVNEELPEDKVTKQISLGNQHSAVVTEDGSLYTWGWNGVGQLGNGNSTSSYYPLKIRSDVASVALGSDHSAAVTKDGSLYMWGYNYYGQLGVGNKQDIHVPTRIRNDIASVSLAGSHSAAITKDGSLYMWGSNSSGQLGNGTSTDSYVPTKIMDNVASVSLKNSRSAALKKDGTLYMWGYESSSYSPTKIMDNVASVSLGYNHYAVITTDGSLYMWGSNYHGELGDGSYVSRSSPVKIMDNVTSVSLGYYHSAAITTDGSLYMWGYNSFGQLGTSEVSLIPTKIMDNVASVSLGEYHSGAITKDGKIYMWGRNNYGQLGNGTTTNSPVPIEINLTGESAAAVSYSATSAIATLSADTSFTNLLPNEVYNIYGMKSRTASDPFSADNLLYISQGVTDSTGRLTYDYKPVADYPNPEIFCKAMKEFEVGNAQITDISAEKNRVTLFWDTYPGAKMYKIYKVINGIYIEEAETAGTAYIVNGLESGKEYGFMVASRVNGEWSYQSEDDVVYITTIADEKEEEKPSVLKGDANRDGEVNSRDAALILRYAAGYSVDIDLAAADVTGEGDVNSRDAALILRKAAGYDVSFAN